MIIKTLKKNLPHKKIDNDHYGQFLGSFNFLRILSWNIFHPNRIINRLLWNTFFVFLSSKIKKFSKEIKNKDLLNKFIFFIKNGGVVIENYFSEEKIDNFLNEYKGLIEEEKKKIINDNQNISQYHAMYLPLSQALIDLWLEDNMVKFIESYSGNKIFAREYPRLIYTKYLADDELTSKNSHAGKYSNKKVNGPYFWHVDHASGHLNLHILLHDTSVEDSHMQFLPESNQYFNSRDLFSNEVVSKFKNKPIDCVGKKGTVYFHQGNTLHKVVGKKYSERLNLIFSFSKGARIEMNCEIIAKAFSGDFDINKLSKEKRNILKGIFPLNGSNDLINKNLVKPKFSEDSSVN